jgi:hypothetical protein
MQQFLTLIHNSGAKNKMPFKSKSQRRFMYSQHPELAKEFEAATPKNAKLPEHVKAGGHVNKTSHKLMNDLKKWMTK